MAAEHSLYFRQLLSGRDDGAGDPLAAQMVNFSYLIGDRASGQALVVDPAYRVADLVAAAAADGMEITGALVSHHHPDHVGGSMMGYSIEGVAELLAVHPVPVHAHRDEVASIMRVTGAAETDMVGHDSGDVVEVGAVPVELLHTPGHTPGSQCFLVAGRLVSGDTLFLEGCGRTDLPGGDVEAMYRSLRHLAALPDDVAVYPGHQYSAAASASMEEVRATNVVYRPSTEAQWMAMFAGR